MDQLCKSLLSDIEKDIELFNSYQKENVSLEKIKTWLDTRHQHFVFFRDRDESLSYAYDNVDLYEIGSLSEEQDRLRSKFLVIFEKISKILIMVQLKPKCIEALEILKSINDGDLVQLKNWSIKYNSLYEDLKLNVLLDTFNEFKAPLSCEVRDIPIYLDSSKKMRIDASHFDIQFLFMKLYKKKESLLKNVDTSKFIKNPFSDYYFTEEENHINSQIFDSSEKNLDSSLGSRNFESIDSFCEKYKSSLLFVSVLLRLFKTPNPSIKLGIEVATEDSSLLKIQEEWIKKSKLNSEIDANFFKSSWLRIDKNSFDYFLDLNSSGYTIFRTWRFSLGKESVWYKQVIIEDLFLFANMEENPIIAFIEAKKKSELEAIAEYKRLISFNSRQSGI